MKKNIILLLLFVISGSYAQNVNQYKYALVPSKFEFLRETDKYQLNSLTKFLMEKEGFVAFLDTDEMPDEMLLSNCNKIYVDVLSSGNFMSTKLTVVLKDCKNNILYTSEEGKSKEKDYKRGYHEALRNAFKSFNTTLHYVYSPSSTVAIAEKPAVAETVVVAPVASTPVVSAPVVVAPVVAKNAVSPVATQSINISDENLFAQPIENGYQLIDKTPKVIMKIYNTSVKDVYSARMGDLQGVFMSKNNEWYFEYYKDDKLISQKINVKL